MTTLQVTSAEPPAIGAERHEPSPRWSLASRLGEVLRTNGVRHCAWKGDPKLSRFESGGGDLDLLIDRHQWADLIAATTPLGFRLALAAPDLVAPGVHSCFAPHPVSGALLHLHVHTQLLVGSQARSQFHLPVERALLDSAVWDRGLRVPTPAFAYVLHVLHQTLRHSVRDIALRRDPAWLRSTEPARAELEARIDPAAVRLTLERHLPMLPPALFALCVEMLRPGSAAVERLATATELRHALRAHARQSGSFALVRRATRRVADAFGATRPREGRARPAAGGVVIALVGGDGAGKSTCAAALVDWLGHAYDVRHWHLGRPAKGPLTLIAGLAHKAAVALQSRLPIRATRMVAEHTELLRAVCTALDRARAHGAAHTHAARGGVAICERHPASEHEALAGPSERQGVATAAASWLADRLRRHERARYAALVRPDLTFALRLDPELAVRRKPEEPASYVRRRAQLVSARQWDRPDERIIDAGRPLAEVLRDMRHHAWELF